MLIIFAPILRKLLVGMLVDEIDVKHLGAVSERTKRTRE
jgi:hypothetical protein